MACLRHARVWPGRIYGLNFEATYEFGVNYGEAGASWLLSPQFRQNESLAEIRYQWRKTNSSRLNFGFGSEKSWNNRY